MNFLTRNNAALDKVLFEKLNTTFNIDSLDPQMLAGCYFAGGCISSLLSNEKPNDYDLFFLGQRAYEQARRSMRSAVTFESSSALKSKTNVHLIKRLFGQPNEVIPTFDFEHCCFYWRLDPFGERGKGLTYYTIEALEALTSKTLVYKPTAFSKLSAVARIQKFSSRGFRLSSSSILKMVNDLQKLNLTDRAVIRNELLGFYSLSEAKINAILDSSMVDGKIVVETVISQLEEL